MGRSRRPAAAVTLLAAVGMAAGCAGGRAAGDGGDGARERALDLPGPLDGRPAGYALSFDGLNDYATMGNAGFPQAGGDQTVEMWVNYESAATTQDFYVARVDFDGGVQIGLRDGTVTVWRTYSRRVLVSAPTLPPSGVWHHVAYAFDGTTHTLYIDGALVASSTATSDIRTPNQAWLGTVDGSAELYMGLMDEVRVWTVARTAADITKDLLHRPPGPEPGLVAYWTFDDVQSGGHSLDLTGGGDDVTLGDGIAERMPNRVLSDAPVSP
jgi:hypothetical protein